MFPTFVFDACRPSPSPLRTVKYRGHALNAVLPVNGQIIAPPTPTTKRQALS